MKTKILYIEDELFLGKIVSETLQLQGFEVMHLNDGSKVISTLFTFMPQICVLDIMLPDRDGYSVCKEIKDYFPSLPVIFLTAKSETADLVKGFEAGATDYIKKPFSIEELIVRINNQLNLRSVTQNNNSEIINIGKYTLLASRYELQSPTAMHKLSSREMEILQLLIAAPNKVVPRRDILIKVWGDDSFFNSRTLDVYMRKMRSLFAEDSAIELVTLKGKGYLFLIKQQ